MSRKVAAGAVASFATAIVLSGMSPANAATQSGVAIMEVEGYHATSVDGGFNAARGDLYGALAISRSSARVSSAVNYGSWAAAENGARAECARRDCEVVVNFRNACGSVSQGADYRFGWSWAPGRGEAERLSNEVLGMSAPPFPDPGSASPRPARVILSACTANAG
ncbi:DUF4189 domain-containing protein [Nocardia sp. XZ_19_385]|uniref:DUF4189 domain-containing protein n=1 Tax=Nocardia sp. XZ_19_385 TaxID=2769488 RepID=UPI00188ECF6E|nr:DUF4189 domain-containing protein [Nocardia sp. XZ_19_385]